MTVVTLADATWMEVAAAIEASPPNRLVAILPIGAVEAHGPHLPLSTDRVIAQAMAEYGAERLATRGWTCLLLPPLDYTPAAFGSAFAGTVSLRPSTAAAMLVDIAASLARHGVSRLAIANAHLDPENLEAIDTARIAIHEVGAVRVAFPDITRKPWALRLTDEFKSGACHAGQYEGSIVLARRADLVREHVAKDLAPNPMSLSHAIREGKTSFVAAGGPDAYFGDPAAASAAEGDETIKVLGEILAEAVELS